MVSADDLRMLVFPSRNMIAEQVFATVSGGICRFELKLLRMLISLVVFRQKMS